jgi:hypothetical protein
MTTFSRSILLCSVFLAVSHPARATVLIGADVGELARDARAIARGRVAAVQGQWTADHRTIETIVTLDVESYLKGALGRTVQFRVPGGALGRFRSVVVGAPAFQVDERVVVFLGATGPSVAYVLGLSQGVFRVVPGTDASAWLVTPPAIMPSTVSVTIARGDPARRPLPLPEFEQRVRTIVAGAR